jgi:transposase
MSKRQRHLQGHRGETFLGLIRGVPQEQIVCVSIDVHKYYHKVLIHNAYGEILVPSFSIDTFQSGFDHLCSVVDEIVVEAEVRVLFIGMEPTGHYFENLARHLLKRYPHIRLVNSYAVKENRDQKMLRRLKTDAIDLGAIGDLVIRNECFPYQPLEGVYLCLQNWVRFRDAKVKARTALKNQIIGHLDRIFPGLVRPNKKAQGDHPPLFSRFWENETAQHLVRLCPDPRKLARMHPAELIKLFHSHDWRMGMKTAERIVCFAQKVLMPDDEVVGARLPLLEIDLVLLETLDLIIARVEKQIAHCLAKTRGQVLTHIKGVGVLRSARYVAGMGNPEHYEYAGQTFKRSGLISGRSDSGTHQSGGEGHRVTKVGDSHFRAALIELTRGLCQWQPYFGDYRARLEARGKHPGVAVVATARKVNNVLFALMRDQTVFDPRDARGRPIQPRASTRDKGKATIDIGSSKVIP